MRVRFMKAAVIVEPGLIQILDVEKPIPGSKEVLAKVKYCGICGTDIAILTGEISFVKNGLIKYPVRIGHEWSGIVVEIGKDVKDFQIGDAVVGDNGVACGECKPCMLGDYSLCENGRAVGTVKCWDGAFAEYMLLPAKHLHKLSSNIALDDAAIIETTSIAYKGVRECGLQPDSTLVIIGMGAIGLAAISVAKYLGIGRVVAVGRNKSKLEVAAKMGADYLVNTTDEDLDKAIGKITNGKGADAVIEASGNITTINMALNVIKGGGTLALVGFYETNLNDFDIDKMTINGITMKGISGAANITPHIIEMLSSGKVDLKPLITRVEKFENINEVFYEQAKSNAGVIRTLIEF